MAEIQQLDGEAVVNFEITLPQQPPIPLTPSIVTYIGSTLMEDVFGMKEYRHTFGTMLPDFFNSIIRSAMATGTPAFRFRLGVGQPNNITWLPWQEHYIVHCSAKLEGISKTSGHIVELTTSDAFHVMKRAKKTAARKGTISDIVQAIASENSLQAVVEPTMGEYLFVQSHSDDFSFVHERMIQRAANAKGRGNYLFFILDNVLHFHTADYQTTVKQLHYYKQPHIGLVQVDRSQQLWSQGVSGTRLIAHDPLTGESIEVLSAPDKTLRYADGIYALDTIAKSQRTILRHISANRLQETVAAAQNAYENARLNTFEISADFDKSITVRTGDIVDLVISQQTEKTSSWSGNYLVTAVVYTIAQNAVSLKLIIRRGEIQPDTSNVTVNATNQQLVPEQQAPGQDINTQDAQGSSETRGVGAQSSASTFATVVSSPNTPLQR